MNGRHIQQKSHLNAAGFAQRAEMGMGICTLLQESAKRWREEERADTQKDIVPRAS